jgi:hypothetical protein
VCLADAVIQKLLRLRAWVERLALLDSRGAAAMK